MHESYIVTKVWDLPAGEVFPGPSFTSSLPRAQFANKHISSISSPNSFREFSFNLDLLPWKYVIGVDGNFIELSTRSLPLEDRRLAYPFPLMICQILIKFGPFYYIDMKAY